MPNEVAGPAPFTMTNPSPDKTSALPPAADTRRTPLSVVIITRNEEACIRRCLESVKWADEIVVVDQFSIDATVDICREYTDRIYERDMVDGFGRQKQFGVDHATHDWIFNIDADEWLSDELSASMQALLASGPQDAAYEAMRRTQYLGKSIMHCGWYVPILRLFDRRRGGYNERRIHEDIVVDGHVARLDGDLLHESYLSIRHHMDKLNLFTDYDAEVMDERGVVVRPLNFWYYFGIKPLIMFLRKYILMAGFLDGVRGFIISMFTGVATMIIYMKAWHLQHQRQQKPSDPQRDPDA